MSQQSVNLFETTFEDLFSKIKDSFPGYVYDFKRHSIILENEETERVGLIRLPLHLSIDDQLFISRQEVRTLYLSIASGNAAICVMDGKSNSYHTTFSAYMTRKKQGVSQIKYLNKKGKSRAGSRVRLAKTLEFFEEINTTLTKLLIESRIDRIAINCSTTLIPYLHQSKVPCPFDKKDNRLYKIPLHIPQSNFNTLDKTIKKLMAPVLFFDQIHEKQFIDAGLS